MSKETIDVLSNPLDIHLPPNWEQAHGYRNNAPFIAIWWADSGETVHIDDGAHRITTYSKPFYEGLLGMATSGGRHELYEPLGYTGESATHCLLIDLEERTIYYALLDEALTWITQSLPSSDQGPVSQEEQTDTDDLWVCVDCGGFGWVRASERLQDGYVPCRSCGGSEWVTPRIGYLQRVRTSLEMEHGQGLYNIKLDAASLLDSTEEEDFQLPVNAAFLLDAIAQTLSLNDQERHAVLGSWASKFISKVRQWKASPPGHSGRSDFPVITVPSFNDFVDETLLMRGMAPARIVLGEKTRQRNGLPIVEVTLDLQAFNDHGELVWLSKSTTIAGFRRSGTFDDPKKQAHYEAMDDLKCIVEELLDILGFEVCPGRYVLLQDLLPLNGVFDCAEWYKDEDEHLQVRRAPGWGGP